MRKWHWFLFCLLDAVAVAVAVDRKTLYFLILQRFGKEIRDRQQGARRQEMANIQKSKRAKGKDRFQSKGDISHAATIDQEYRLGCLRGKERLRTH